MLLVDIKQNNAVKSLVKSSRSPSLDLVESTRRLQKSKTLKSIMSWNSHRRVPMISFAPRTTIASVIDDWNKYRSNTLPFMLQQVTLNCTAGPTGCGRPATMRKRFGDVPPVLPQRWSMVSNTIMRTAEQVAQKARESYRIALQTGGRDSEPPPSPSAQTPASSSPPPSPTSSPMSASASKRQRTGE